MPLPGLVALGRAVRSAVLLALVLGSAAGCAGSRSGPRPADGPGTPDLVRVSSDGETDPGPHEGDSIDEPSLWVDRADPSRSLVMVNDKAGAFLTYDLHGRLVQRLGSGSAFWGNSDVRQGVRVGGFRGDLVAVQQGGLRFLSVDPRTRRLSSVTQGGGAVGAPGEGLCLYRDGTDHSLSVYSITRPGVMTQYAVTDPDGDGLLEADPVRTVDVGSEAEGCVADDETGALYVSEEDVAIWRYGARAGDGHHRTAVDVMGTDGGHLVPDIEGLTLVTLPGGRGYLVASAQNVADPHASYFAAYRRSDLSFVTAFRVTSGSGSDDCDRTDGIAAVAADLGPRFPEGVFVCQDNNNDAPGTRGNEDLKLVRLERLLEVGAG